MGLSCCPCTPKAEAGGESETRQLLPRPPSQTGRRRPAPAPAGHAVPSWNSGPRLQPEPTCSALLTPVLLFLVVSSSTGLCHLRAFCGTKAPCVGSLVGTSERLSLGTAVPVAQPPGQDQGTWSSP